MYSSKSVLQEVPKSGISLSKQSTLSTIQSLLFACLQVQGLSWKWLLLVVAVILEQEVFLGFFIKPSLLYHQKWLLLARFSFNRCRLSVYSFSPEDFGHLITAMDAVSWVKSFLRDLLQEDILRSWHQNPFYLQVPVSEPSSIYRCLCLSGEPVDSRILKIIDKSQSATFQEL